jgi:hypothetical protein
MIAPWNSPIINTFTTDDAARLQQVFMSLSRQLAEMSKEIADLKREIKSMDLSGGYGLRR